ncbi:MAG: T9SS type A sorting domain-containing protein [Bacteroidetes bacterium]|nr:T9SS type A sorting domain-containing protein [Bacteroidota bacterium]
MKTILTATLILGALSLYSQTSNHLVVHEWGTFSARYTANGTPYQNMQDYAHEPVPSFVHHIDLDSTFEVRYVSFKGDYYTRNDTVELRNISIKMETPVLYFYSPATIKDLEVSVDFPQGSISEFYPRPNSSETYNLLKSKIRIENDWSDLPHKSYISFSNYGGYVSWKINVLSPEQNTVLTHPDEEVPNVWSAPRKTDANLIKVGEEVEKYIFYRGLGGFENPVSLKYTDKGNLVINNTLNEEIPYCLIYEMKEDGSRYIWGYGKLDGGRIRHVSPVSDSIPQAEWVTVYKPKFIDELVKAGLYRDEAMAMFNTWEASYFETTGLRVFWIVPRSFTDKTLPIHFSMNPSSVERIMVGRSEIDSWNENESDLLDDDRNYSEAFNNVHVYPNPADNQITVTTDDNGAHQATWEIYDAAGRLCKSLDLNIGPMQEKSFSVSDLKSGIYTIRIAETGKAFRICIQH